MRPLLENWRNFLSETPKKETVIFMAGGPASGKSTVLQKLGIDLTTINTDDFYEQYLIDDPELSLHGKVKVYKKIQKIKKDMGDNPNQPELEKELSRLKGLISKYAKAFSTAQKKKREMIDSRPKGGFVIDGTGGDLANIKKQKEELDAEGYNVAMIFVDVDMDVALSRNMARGSGGGRQLLDREVVSSHNSVQKNKPLLANLFGNNFIYINTTDEETFLDTLNQAKEKIYSLDKNS